MSPSPALERAALSFTDLGGLVALQLAKQTNFNVHVCPLCFFAVAFPFHLFSLYFPLPLYPNSRLCSSTFMSPPILCLGTLAVTFVCDVLGSEEDPSLTNLESPANWCSKQNIGLHCSVVSITHPLKLYKHKQTMYFFVCQQKMQNANTIQLSPQ